MGKVVDGDFRVKGMGGLGVVGESITSLPLGHIMRIRCMLWRRKLRMAIT